MTTGCNAAAKGMADHIRFELFVRRVSAPQLAEFLGRDVKTIRRHLRGETPWPVGEVWQIAEYLDMPVYQLTGDEQ